MTTITIDQHRYDIDAILFDKDGTLLNFGDLWLSWLTSLLELIDGRLYNTRPIQRQVVAAGLGVSADYKQWDPTGPLTIGSMDDIAAILALSLYQGGHAWNDATRIIRDCLEELTTSRGRAFPVTPVDGLLTFLAQARARGVLMAVVTSDETLSARQHLTELDVAEYFPVVIGHDQVLRGKPYPDMALAACEQLGVPPGRTLLFGDSNGDMQMAREAGLAACMGLTPAPHLGTQHLGDADLIIRSYSEVGIL